jgi:hypothetical protein
MRPLTYRGPYKVRVEEKAVPACGRAALNWLVLLGEAGVTQLALWGPSTPMPTVAGSPTGVALCGAYSIH